MVDQASGRAWMGKRGRIHVEADADGPAVRPYLFVIQIIQDVGITYHDVGRALSPTSGASVTSR